MPHNTQPTLMCGPPSWPGPGYRSTLLILNKRHPLLILLLLKESVLPWTLLHYNSLQIQGLKHKHLIDPVQVTSPGVGIRLAQLRSCGNFHPPLWLPLRELTRACLPLCISYLLLCNKSSQNLAAENKKHVIFHSF